MSLRKRLGAVAFHLAFGLYALLLAPLVLARLRGSVEDGAADPTLAWVILAIGALEIPALYWKIQAIAHRLSLAATARGAKEIERPGLLFVGWLCHFVISGVMVVAFYEALGAEVRESDPDLHWGMIVLVVKEFWLGGFLFLAKGRAVPRVVEFASDLGLLAFACLMYTVFWQYSLEGADMDEYAYPLLIMNAVLVAFFFLLSYTATQLPYLWEHSAGLQDENEYGRWLLALVGTAVVAVAPILYATLDGRYGDLREALAAEGEEPGEVRTLVLSRSKLDRLSPRVGEFPGLRTLYLHGNRLAALPPEIGGLPRLEKLQASYNRLRSVPAELGRLRNLKTLQMYGNRLTVLPDAIGELDRLEELHVGWNPLRRLPDSVTKLENLRVLNVSDCRLEALPEDIGRLRKLRVLKAPNNRLTDLPESLFTLDLEEVKLQGNALPAELMKRVAARYPAPK
jgi:CDP-diglyceride synthetase